MTNFRPCIPTWKTSKNRGRKKKRKKPRTQTIALSLKKRCQYPKRKKLRSQLCSMGATSKQGLVSSMLWASGLRQPRQPLNLSRISGFDSQPTWTKRTMPLKAETAGTTKCSTSSESCPSSTKASKRTPSSATTSFQKSRFARNAESDSPKGSKKAQRSQSKYKKPRMARKWRRKPIDCPNERPPHARIDWCRERI